MDGFLSENDEESFAEKILAAARDGEKLRLAGKAAAESQYISWKTCTDRLLERLTEIVKERKEKGAEKVK